MVQKFRQRKFKYLGKFVLCFLLNGSLEGDVLFAVITVRGEYFLGIGRLKLQVGLDNVLPVIGGSTRELQAWAMNFLV